MSPRSSHVLILDVFTHENIELIEFVRGLDIVNTYYAGIYDEYYIFEINLIPNDVTHLKLKFSGRFEIVENQNQCSLNIIKQTLEPNYEDTIPRRYSVS